jgi:hypothetical protein
MVTTAIAIAASIGMPSGAAAQVVVIIGSGAAQPYYPPPFPFPYVQPFAQPFPRVVYGGPGYFPAYGRALAVGNGYYGGYNNGYYGNGYYQSYGAGW